MTVFSRPRKLPRLALNTLESRITPASAVYTAATQTLTITAAQGDQLVVAAIANKPASFIAITETQAAATVFNGDTTNQGVLNLIVKFGGVNTGDFILDSTAKLGGNLNISGAKSTQTVSLFGSVGGNVTYTAAVAPAIASDQFDLEAPAFIGGNLSINSGSGANTTQLKGGTVRGNLTVVGLSGNDRVEITASADLTVGMAASFNLGSGNNTVIGLGTHNVKVGGSFTYTGGIGNDTFNLDGSGAGLIAGVDAKFTFGTPLGFDSNSASFELLSAGRNISIVGGAGTDTIETSGLLSAWGNLTATLGAGANSFDSNQDGTATNTIGGNLTYVGGPSDDTVQIDNTTIGRSLSIGLGEANGGATAFVGIGLKGPGSVSVYGNVKVTKGATSSGIYFQRTHIGGGLTVLGLAGSDVVVMDDMTVTGPTLIDLGAGDDFIHLEESTNGAVPLLGTSTFGGSFTFRGSAGNDGVFVAQNSTPGAQVIFGGKVNLLGGTGTDEYKIKDGAKFELAGNTSDVEVSNIALP